MKASLCDTEVPIQYQAFTPHMSITYLLPSDVAVFPQPSQSFQISPAKQRAASAAPMLPTLRAQHHISHLPEAQHFHSLTPSHHTPVLSCHTPPPLCKRSPTHPSPFQVQKHSTAPPQPYPTPHTPHSLADSHSSTLTHAVCSPLSSPPLGTELPHTQQPHRTDTSNSLHQHLLRGVLPSTHIGAGRHGQLGSKKKANQPRWAAEGDKDADGEVRERKKCQERRWREK